MRAQRYWKFDLDPIHRLHAVHAERRVFTPPPEHSQYSPMVTGMSAESPRTPPTPLSDDEDEAKMMLPPPLEIVSLWNIRMAMPETLMWRISFAEPQMMVSG